jgi:hypothetical protein
MTLALRLCRSILLNPVLLECAETILTWNIDLKKGLKRRVRCATIHAPYRNQHKWTGMHRHIKQQLLEKDSS